VRGHHPIETGSGLGLSIVQRIAELHHASLELRDPPAGGQGLCVCVSFESQG
jgi:signal transduction histidine kinase